MGTDIRGIDMRGGVTTLDKNPLAKPDVIQDWSKRITAKNKHMIGGFDVITTACCDYSAFFHRKGYPLVPQSFQNVSDCLKDGGRFIWTIPYIAIMEYMQTQSNTPLGKRKQWRIENEICLEVSRIVPTLKYIGHRKSLLVFEKK